jgi:hypothetical protein
MKDAIENFCYFLEDTFIPDLIESGDKSTAKDFKEAIKYMRQQKRASKETRTKFLELLRESENHFREEGRDFTADDYFTAYQFIYWLHN